MKNVIKWTLATLVALVSVAVLSGCVATSNETLADRITSEVRTNDVVFINDATIDEESLVKDFNGRSSKLYSGSSIVIVDEQDIPPYDPQELSDYVLEENYPEDGTINILVVNGENDSEIYVSAMLPEIREKVESQLGKSDTDEVISSERPGWLLINNIEKIREIQRDNDGHLRMSTVFMWAGIAIGGLIAVILLLVLADNLHLKLKKKNETRKAVRKAKRERKEAAREVKRRRKEREDRASKSASVDKFLESQVNTLAEKSLKLQNSDPELSSAIESVLERFTQLREAITLMETTEHRKNMLYIGLKDRFESLVTLVGPKYYEDFKTHPDHWNNPQEKIASVPLAFRAMDAKLLENIRQLKEGSEFDFEVALDKIVGFHIDPSEMLK